MPDENRSQNIAITTHTNTSNETTTTSVSSSSGNNASNTRQSFNSDILRRPINVVEQQPSATGTVNVASNDSAYVNTEYTNRETLLCDAHFDKQQLVNMPSHIGNNSTQQVGQSGSSGLYLNTAAFQNNSRISVNSNGIIRKIPENLVLKNTPLPESQQNSVQPSPALSTASGPYIPISECYSGSPKFMVFLLIIF